MPFPLTNQFFKVTDAPAIPPQSTPLNTGSLVFGKSWWLQLNRIFGAVGFLLGNPYVQWGTDGERLAIPPERFTEGMIFYVTDRNNIAYQIQDGAWVFLAGHPWRVAQSDLESLRLSLGLAETGLCVEIADYRHVLRWNGSAFTWGPGEDGRHDIVGLPVDPDDPIGWQLCDGTTVAYLKGDGTTEDFVTPDLIGASADAYLKLGETVSGPNAAVAPTYTPPTVDAALTGISTTTTPSATTVGVLSAGQSLPTGSHTHGVVDTTHTHGLTNGSVGDDGEPRNVVLRPWFRR